MTWRKLTAVTAIAVGLSGSLAGAAEPAGRCTERDAALKTLKDKYQEVPVAVGVASDGNLVEVLSNEDGKTWTIMLTKPGGESCFVAAGEGLVWRKLLPSEPEA